MGKKKKLSLEQTQGFVFKDEADNPISFDIYHNIAEPNSRCRYIKCDLCNQTISIGASHIRTWLEKHRNDESCVKCRDDRVKQDRDAAIIAGASLARSQLQRSELRTSSSSTGFESTQTSAYSSPFPTSSSVPTPGSSTPSHNITPWASLGPGVLRLHYVSSQPFDNQTLSITTSLHNVADLPPSSPPHEFNALDNLGSDLWLYTEASDSDTDTLDPLPISEEDACTGQLIYWSPPGPLWDSYCLQQHIDSTVPWVLIGIEVNNNKWIRVMSKDCKVMLSTPKEKNTRTCSECAAIRHCDKLVQSMERATSSPSIGMQWERLNSRQMIRVMSRLKSQNERLRLKLLNKERALARAYNQKYQEQAIRVFISQNNIPALGRHLAMAIQRRESLQVTLKQLEEALYEGQTCRGSWSDLELAKAQLAHILGGRRLVYALSKADGLPSLSSLYRLRPIPEILPSITQPSAIEVAQNIESMLGAKGQLPPRNPAIGQALLIDDISIEENP
ncbi:hypothetical protein CVT24_001646 [Panaeolus cyanescens]|uniref:Uncharacterized protein n=1 Tax=Panaeolus cyanescens TaxID=181874 RepID=A0A409X4S4_9AGAR|nr:hypothetical protein CVT24_001646 [Panaeolus cyanescens]